MGAGTPGRIRPSKVSEDGAAVVVRGLEPMSAELRRRYDTLTQRKREVMTLVVTGLLNK